jgi:Calcineurin-like phosphoesterase
MNRNLLNIVLILVAAVLVFVACTTNEEQSEFSFIATCDMRAFATEEFRSSEWTLGGFQAIEKIGKGEFMVSPGDVEPPWAVRELLDQVFGKDYIWYPSVGNHDLEDKKYIEYLRDYNKDGTKLPNIVSSGPSGSVETTYSFDFGNTHFVNLNLYYDGKTDGGTDGDVVPELLKWLENDLAQNKKKNIFVFGHDAIISMPDMDNGLVRHQGNVLDKYPENSFAFQQLLLKYDVTAYLCGHSHSTSFSKINGLWQLDLGHIRGMMNEFDTQKLFDYIEVEWEKNEKESLSLRESIEKTYNSKTKSINKTLFTTQLAGVGKESYKNISPTEGKKGLLKFYQEYSKGNNQADKLTSIFWDNSNWQRSSFFRITVSEDDISVKIYRDDARGGEYTLRHSFSLN